MTKREDFVFTKRSLGFTLWRLTAYARMGGICLCGEPMLFPFRDVDKTHPHLATVDHIIALGDGGTNDYENLQLLCSTCNQEKEVRRRAQFTESGYAWIAQVRDALGIDPNELIE